MIYFSSDHHFWHTNILKFCPNRNYSSIEEMNESYVNLWNSVVNPEDIVYYLGDFSMAIRPVETFTPRLNGKKILIYGNHDWCHPSHKKSNTPGKQLNMFNLYKSYGWSELHESCQLDIGDISLKLCHLPYKSGDDTHDNPRKYSTMYPEDEGTTLLHGHIHQHHKIQYTSKNTLMINVGVDVWDGTPVSLDTILEIVKNHN